MSHQVESWTSSQHEWQVPSSNISNRTWLENPSCVDDFPSYKLHLIRECSITREYIFNWNIFQNTKWRGHLSCCWKPVFILGFRKKCQLGWLGESFILQQKCFNFDRYWVPPFMFESPSVFPRTSLVSPVSNSFSRPFLQKLKWFRAYIGGSWPLGSNGTPCVATSMAVVGTPPGTLVTSCSNIHVHLPSGNDCYNSYKVGPPR